LLCFGLMAAYPRKGCQRYGSITQLKGCVREQVEYSAEQLDVLAILFTCVKVLYVGGAVERTWHLIQVRILRPVLSPYGVQHSDLKFPPSGSPLACTCCMS
jgi:hypothetical protein